MNMHCCSSNSCLPVQNVFAALFPNADRNELYEIVHDKARPNDFETGLRNVFFCPAIKASGAD
ncbi:MAG TPA: hypothetical protein DCL72_02230 [Rhizobiales bacterium]|jgi:hypothetical protein|nr:hypothetical protein [Hyphomicrobiales bacterium]HAN62459.1 hypothetical protein [Hyphomicrobiales bacterium]